MARHPTSRIRWLIFVWAGAVLLLAAPFIAMEVWGRLAPIACQ